jgi:hypothetical protein
LIFVLAFASDRGGAVLCCFSSSQITDQSEIEIQEIG